MADYRSTGKELRKSPKGMIAGLLAVALLGGAGFGVYRIAKGFSPIAPESSEASEIIIPDLTEPAESDPGIIYTYENMFASDMHKGPLMYVGGDYATEDITEGLVNVYSEKNEHFGMSTVNIQLMPEAVEAFNALTEAYYNDKGTDGFLLSGGYRSKADQRVIYSDAVAAGDNHAAMAGFSDYETGYAVSVLYTKDGQYLNPASDDAADFAAWMDKYAADYGFILRFPVDKLAQTEMSFDATHYRYVGIPHAQYMKEHNLCLEEYLDELAQTSYTGDHLALPGGYEAFLVRLENGDDTGTVEVPVPAEVPYTCSGDNRSGFIVTVESGET